MRNVGGRHPAQQTQESPDFLAHYSFITSIVIRAEKISARCWLFVILLKMYNFSQFFNGEFKRVKITSIPIIGQVSKFRETWTRVVLLLLFFSTRDS